jgi:hypothetical protein
MKEQMAILSDTIYHIHEMLPANMKAELKQGAKDGEEATQAILKQAPGKRTSRK